ncbi:MAG: TonB-dependent receptor [Alphaproteobacteria bacterium]|nr:TonB-dependent receptor [Alphaproteobacteria bacterium]
MSFPDFRGAKRACALAGSLLVTSPAFAETPPVQPEVIVTAPLESARIESLQGASVLKRDDIVAALDGGLGTTLAKTPGIATSFFGAGASRPIIRGLGEDRVLVLQNGIGAIDASTASPDHAVTSDGLDAERIEVLRGAAALAYGGNAIGGVVNVIDQSIPTRVSDGLSGQALAVASSVDDGREGAAEIAGGVGAAQFRLGVSARDTEAYDTPVGVVPNTWTQLRTAGAGASAVGARGFAGVAVKRVETKYGLLPEDAGEPGGRIEMEQTRIESRGDVKVSWGPIDRLDLAAQTSDYTHTEFEGDGAPGTRFESTGWEARGEAHNTIGKLRGATGLQVSAVDFAAFGEEAFIIPTKTDKGGLFTVQRWDAGRWGLEGGARIERVEIEADTARDRAFTPKSVSLGAFARPAESWFLGVTLASAERAPSAVELYADGPHLATETFELGDVGLTTETARSLEASARFTGARTSLELNLFRVAFNDYIALVARGDVFWKDEAADLSGFAATDADPSIPAGAKILPVFNYVQKEATFTGGELSVRRALFDAGPFAISGRIGADIVRASFDAGGAPPRIPPRTVRVGLDADSDAWAGSVEVVDAARQTRTAAFESATDGYTLVNASLVWRPQGKDGVFTVRLDGRNLTDELARVHTSFLKDKAPLPGRSMRLALTAQF